jgi:cell division protein FtsQ
VARARNRRKVEVDPAAARERKQRALGVALRAVGGVAALLALALLGWRGWTEAVEGDLLRIRELRFEGLSRVPVAELRELAAVREGDHLLLSDLDALGASLRRHPWIASVEVRRALPPALEIRVTERKAAALVDFGGLYLVDEEAHVFKRATPGDGLDLPLVTGIGREDFVGRQAEVEPLLAGALALANKWSERGLDRRAVLSEIHVDPDWGVSLFAGDEGMEVRLGTGEIPAKLERLERVLASLVAKGEKAQAILLDNRRRPDWVTVRLVGWTAPAKAGAAPGRPALAKGGKEGAREGPEAGRGRGAPLVRR